MRKLNPLKLKDYDWNNIEILLVVEEYTNNNQLAILLYEKETWEYYTDLSVFVEEFSDKSYMAVDINNFPDAENIIKEHNLWQLVDYVHSWFVTYPVYEMDLDRLSQYDPEGVEKFKKDNNISKPKTVFDRLK